MKAAALLISRLAAETDKARTIELALHKFPAKTQQEIADQVGCAIGYVNKVKQELFKSEKLNLPTKRKGKDGKEHQFKPGQTGNAGGKPKAQAEANSPSPSKRDRSASESRSTRGRIAAEANKKASQFKAGESGNPTGKAKEQARMNSDEPSKRDCKSENARSSAGILAKWLPWVEANLPFSQATAKRYIQCYQGKDKLKSLTMSDLTDAYRLLAGKSEALVTNL